MKVNFKELRDDWNKKFKNGCKNLEENELCACFKQDHYTLDEEPIKCNMHKCPDFKPKLSEAMKKLGATVEEEEKVKPKEKEMKVDKI